MAGQSCVFTMSRWSLCVSLWEAANKKAHLTRVHCWDAFVLRVVPENMGTFTNEGFKKILF